MSVNFLKFIKMDKFKKIKNW